jgi:quercetin dioxygenase-like cupin family protein
MAWNAGLLWAARRRESRDAVHINNECKEQITMSDSVLKIVELASAVEPPDDGIISRTVYNDETLKAVAFGFGVGQELSEHTATTGAVMHFLSGEADVTLGEQKTTAREGTWIHMPPALSHSIVAKTPVVMLLLLLKKST